MGRQTGNQTGSQAPQQVIENKDVLRFSSLKRAGNGQANGHEEEEVKERKSALEGFEDWYAEYPRKKSRADAARAFTKVIGSNLIALPTLMEKTKAFAALCASKPEVERKFIPYPASWLNAGGYDDEPDGAKPVSAPVARDPRTFTDADWQKRLTYLQEADKWVPDWGPKPGEPGCLVPSHLLIAPVSKGAA
jgi:hypothetical protein